ncbi:SGNH/GDSL hydrolase family protein [Antiquaquibacter oligotrophicus]|nr:SGNH/GDSL hydrolase family protein [Antiquaquibacter oligotrophicus]UDF12636.1 SGNH/GDSL hydrolase family protein [Antiquaquibacter oligotrophicus]
MSGGHRTRRALRVVIALCAVTLLAGCFPSVSDVVDTSGAPADGAIVDYSFGHTIGVAEQFADAPIDALQRLPLELAATPTSLRVHIRNWNYLSDEPVQGSLTVTDVWLGQQAADGPGYATAPAHLAAGGTIVDGATYTTPWVSADELDLEAGVPQLLSIGLRSDAGTALAVTGGVAWVDFFGSSGLGGRTDAIGQFTGSFSLLDVWVEYTVDEDTPRLVVLGHSLNSPGNIDPAAHPHEGEKDSWPQLWAQANGGAASTLSASGSWLLSYPVESPKWTTFEGMTPDFVTLWAASNDIASAQPIEAVRVAFLTMLDRARALWPEAKIVAFTEPPRGNTSELDAVRVEWNEWLLSNEVGLFAVVDVATPLADPGDPLVLRPELTSDGSHLSLAGHELVASLFADAVTPH